MRTLIAVALLAIAGCSSSDAKEACDCDDADVCVEGQCRPAIQIVVSVAQVELSDTGDELSSAGFWLFAWSDSAGADREVVAEEGSCAVFESTVATAPGYAAATLDVGNTWLTIDGGMMTPIPQGPAGGGMVTVAGLASAGGQTVGFANSGGSDLPAITIDVTTAPPLALADVPPWQAGEPWTLRLEDGAPDATTTVELGGGLEPLISCRVEGGSEVTVAPTLTAMLTPAEAVNLGVIRRRTDQATASNGAALESESVRSVLTSVPLAP